MTLLKSKPFVVEDSPENVRKFLLRVRKDPHLSGTFDGKISKGKITGFYTNIASSPRIGIGYNTVKGTFDLEKGIVRLETNPSFLFWFVIGGMMIGVLIHFIIEGTVFPFVIFAVLFILICILIFYLENRSFIKAMKRIYSEVN